MPILTEINIYPIKSLGGFSCTSAVAEMRGLQYDRRWMLIDADGRFISQREIADLVYFKTSITDEVLAVTTPTDQLLLPLVPDLKRLSPCPVRIWDDTVTGLAYSDNTNVWFSDLLNRAVRLVYMPDSTERITDTRYVPDTQYVSFSDGYPYLLISEASLYDLNERMETPLPMNRFRPNFVVNGTNPYEEDHWTDFKIGACHFRGVKPCARCIVTTTDQDTGQRAAEPLKILSTYRNFNKKILFGQNVIKFQPESAMISVGDEVNILSETKPGYLN